MFSEPLLEAARSKVLISGVEKVGVPNVLQSYVVVYTHYGTAGETCAFAHSTLFVNHKSKIMSSTGPKVGVLTLAEFYELFGKWFLQHDRENLAKYDHWQGHRQIEVPPFLSLLNLHRIDLQVKRAATETPKHALQVLSSRLASYLYKVTTPTMEMLGSL